MVAFLVTFTVPKEAERVFIEDYEQHFRKAYASREGRCTRA